MNVKRKVGIANCIAYGVGDMYGGGAFFLISTFSMYFFINVAGLSPFLAGLIPGLGKVWDAVSDPLMGYISDRTKSRFGRRRVYFLVAIVPVFATFALLWVPSPFQGQLATFAFYFIAYLLFYTVTTMTMVPYSALCAEMTEDFAERNRLSGTRMVFSVLATMIVAIFAERIIKSSADPAAGHLAMGLVFAVLYALPWIFVFFGTWELPSRAAAEDEETGPLAVFRNFGTIFRNRSFRVHILMYIAAYTSMDVVMAWLKFYLNDVLQKPGILSTGLAVMIVCEMVMLPAYVALANRKSHGTALITGFAVWFVGMGVFAFHTPETSNTVILLNCALIGAGLSAAVSIPWSILPFVTDVDTLITGKRRAGTYAGAMTLIRKLIQGLLVLPTLGLVLTLIEYRPATGPETVVQTAKTLGLMKLFFIATPMVCIALGIVASLRLAINKKTHRIMMEEIGRLEKGGRKEDAAAETKEICERLSGHPYESLMPGQGDDHRA